MLTDSPECPRCGADPRAGRLASLGILPRVIAALAALVLCVCLGWVVFRTVSTNALERVLGLSTVTPTPQQVQIVYVVATRPLPTSTPVPTATLVPTLAVPPSPTRRGARAASPTATRRTPTPALYPAPQLTLPPNTAVYNGVDANIMLEWQSVAPSGLAENEWYRIWIAYTGRDGKRAEQARWTKETTWTVPAEWYASISPDSRDFSWNVTAVRVDGVSPFASASYVPASLGSATRSFFWH